ncbi:tRNA (adenosine(37)-N6)-dimethylallyltransferase MiaA [Ectothiorhodospiraceae bacterium BW-2]|nr:tRNA (adenosine(37)-N6)-dimethylallyltransferase MiaA [Ectothiorhodospiraceae bacterium BW-2]
MQPAAALIVTGATASGKTALATWLSDQLGGRLISVDSAQIYRGMDIGTAKPSAAELAQHPHALIDILDPAEAYSAARFVADASQAMCAAWEAGEMPILVGGTMLYLRALQQGLAQLPAADAELRAELQQQLQQQGALALHQQLQRLDPLAAEQIHPNDPQRLLRALEISLLSGRPMTALWRESSARVPHITYCKLKLDLDRSLLHQRIATRFAAMIEQGLVAEVEKLYQRGDLSPANPSMRCVGYRQVWDYLQGGLSHGEMVERGTIATRQLAKRQMTWMRSMKDGCWLDSSSASVKGEALSIVERCLRQLLKSC